MLQRKVTEALRRWKEASDKALLVTGARQIGKSFAIRAFGKAEFASYFEANLVLDRDARDLLTESRSAQDFINRLALLSHEPLVEGDCLVFVDEIQECPELITLVKGLVEDGRYSYVFSGSMLGVDLKGISSFPVGYVERIVMRPLDFEEFSWAVGMGQMYLDDVRACLAGRREVDPAVHQAMLKNYRAYMIVGGMPEVVQAYVDDGYVLVRARQMQEQLVGQYTLDIGKYAGTRALEVRSIFDRIPLELEGESHRFTLSTLPKGGRYNSYEHDFEWIVNAGVALKVQQVSEAKSPLRRTQSDSLFKLYQSDTGMLLSRFPQSFSRAVYLDRRQANLGGIFENMVAQELAALGVPMWYFRAPGVGEVDFVIEGRAGHVVPIEVKSGKKVRSHAALDALMAVRDWRIPEAFVLSPNNLSQDGRLTYAPLYMGFCLDELIEKGEGDFTFAPAVL